MKKLYTFILLISVIVLNVKSQNGLDFDGVNDVVSIPNASAGISGSNSISMSLWVNATNTGGPHGIAGLRNNSNADFFILQLNNTTLECRFRNSSGVNYDIVYSGHVLNQWQHFVFTYDGSQLELYKDGISVATASANGTITSSTEELLMGNLRFGTSNFRYAGKIDDFGFWDKTLSASEVSCVFNNGINPFDPDLELYYDFDHGVAGMNNSGVTTLTDRTGNINGTLSGFALNGTNSNWVNGIAGMPTLLSNEICAGDSATFGTNVYKSSGTYFDVTTAANGCDSMIALHLTVRPDRTKTTNATICKGEVYDFNGRTLSTEGTFSDPFTTQDGCDSTITVHLNIDTANTTIVKNGNILEATANQFSNTFQWIDCDDNSIIPGAIGTTFPLNGIKEYAVIITTKTSGCVDTSICLGLTTGIDQVNNKPILSIQPNPVRDLLHLSLNQAFSKVEVTLTNLVGKTVFNQNYSRQKAIKINTATLNSGIYLIEIITDGQRTTQKLTKY